MILGRRKVQTLLSIWSVAPDVEVTARAAELAGYYQNKRVYEVRYYEDGKPILRFVTRYYRYEQTYSIYSEEEKIKKKFQERLAKKLKEHGKKT